MTIIDELLILLDDVGPAPSELIPSYFDSPNLQVIFSTLGRLVNKGWVIKKTNRQETTYAISTPGINELNRTLDTIKHERKTEWDHTWHMVIFDIPEKKRKLRDNLRILLKESCFGMLTSSVWISPYDKQEQLKRFIKLHNLADNIFALTTPAEDNYQTKAIARRCWDWSKLERDYRTFLTYSDKQLRIIEKAAHNQRFLAKKLVFQYAEIVKEDPQLPIEIGLHATIARKAHEQYVRIRPFCLKK
jgi:phenylacetic acid degradation operon negative regulatory protein